MIVIDMKSDALITQLKKVFAQNNVDHFAWLIQGEFGVDFGDFLQHLCGQLFDLQHWKNFSNVLYISGENEIKIEEVRKVNVFLQNKSKKWRIIIIQNAEKMNQNAANALLKILEEPPKKTIFICTAIHELPLTVLSRMNKFFLSIDQNEHCNDGIMQIANGSNVIAEQIIDLGGLESLELMQKIIYEKSNHGALARLMEIIDLPKHFQIVCYLILYLLKKKLLACNDFISKKKVVYQYEEIVQKMAKIEELHCNKKAFLFSFLK